MTAVKVKISQSQPLRDNTWINTEDGISEILYGLIMALTFTCTISVTKTDGTSVDDLLFGALSCNTAWGLIDAVMYLVMTKTDAERGYSIMNYVRKSANTANSRQFIADALPPVIADVLSEDEIEKIRVRLSGLPEPKSNRSQKLKDYKTAAGIFLLVLLSTFPVAIPFLFMTDLQLALRISNGIAIVMMFLCGWGLGKYAGRNSFITGIIMSFFGVALVLLAIVLGG
jgi:hypothetical protein